VSTAPQPAEEPNTFPPTTDHTPHPNHIQEFISAPPAANSVPISQAGSIIGPSVSESIGSVVIRDPDLLVSNEAYEASHDPYQQPVLPATEVAAVATIVRPDDLTPQLPISIMEDISQVPTDTSPTSAHPNSIPMPIFLSSRQPSSFVSDACDTQQHNTLPTTLSHPPGNNE
jgi:hypothetical protein